MTSTTQDRSLLSRLFGARETGLVLIILTLFVIMSFASPHFLTWTNMRAMTMAFSVESIVVVGMTILLISGGIDLSVGSVTALAMVIAGLLFLNGVDPWIASLIAIAACAGIGAIMGFFVTYVGLHHFIVTLAAMVIARGLCLLGTGGRPLGLFELPESFKWIGIGSIGVIPVAIVIFVVVVVVFDFLLRRTTAFRLVYYTGSNEKAAAYSGIRTKRVIFLTTVLCSTLCGVAGIIYMARFGSAQPTFGVGMELNVIAAAVVVVIVASVAAAAAVVAAWTMRRAAARLRRSAERLDHGAAGGLPRHLVGYVERHHDGRGALLLERMEDLARQRGITLLFVLTTQTAHWFRERGFEPARLADLPMAKQALYNYRRNSKVFVKRL
jgi:ribose transport system permease protein